MEITQNNSTKQRRKRISEQTGKQNNDNNNNNPIEGCVAVLPVALPRTHHPQAPFPWKDVELKLRIKKHDVNKTEPEKYHLLKLIQIKKTSNTRLEEKTVAERCQTSSLKDD